MHSISAVIFLYYWNRVPIECILCDTDPSIAAFRHFTFATTALHVCNYGTSRLQLRHCNNTLCGTAFYARHASFISAFSMRWITLRHTATHCNTMQHTATQCNTLQHTATHCTTLATTPFCAQVSCIARRNSLNIIEMGRFRLWGVGFK